ncbi:MAG: lysophospholipid acyltransferase family protein [Candidatus Coproplasma sp.]
MRNKDSKKSFNRMFKLIRFVEKYFFRWLFPYKLHGNLTKYNDGGLIIIGNHYNYLDVAYPLRITDKPINFIAKQELWDEGGFFKWFVTKCQCIPAKRDGSDVATVKQSLKVLREGGVINIFPEGTRNKVDGGDIQPFHGGAAALSIKTRTPIVPIVKIRSVKLFKRTDVIIGDPIEFRQYYGKKVSREELEACDEKMREALNNMRLSFMEKYNIKIKSKKSR